YYNKESKQSLSLKESMYKYCQLKLTEYMVPSCFIFLKSFPLNQNGKIDRKQLPQPLLSDYNASTVNIISPGTELEKLIHSGYSFALKLDPSSISMDSNFFSLGGTSLVAIALITRLSETFLNSSNKAYTSLSLSILPILQYATVKGLAGFYEEQI